MYIWSLKDFHLARTKDKNWSWAKQRPSQFQISSLNLLEDSSYPKKSPMVGLSILFVANIVGIAIDKYSWQPF
jgi:hypothetical protein